MRYFVLFPVLFGLASAVSAAGASLSLEDYLQQVRKAHQGYLGLELSTEGAKLREREGTLLLSPQLFANVALYDDSKQTSNPAFQGTRTQFDSFSLGLGKQFDFGLQAKLSYNLSYTSLTGTSPAFVPQPTFLEGKPLVEFTQSFWRNGFGRETRATMNLAEAAAMATRFGDELKQKVVLAESEATYWRLAVAREIVKSQKENLVRAEKIREWNARRTELSLADKADFLQTDTLVQLKKMELQSAQDEEVLASRSFNSLRGLSSELVNEGILPLDSDRLKDSKVPTRNKPRGDVLAAEQLKRVAQASADLSREKSRPTLDVAGNFGLNGRDPALPKAIGDSFAKDRPVWGVSVKFMAPLDLGTVSDSRNGYDREERAADLQYQRKRFEEEQEWKSLSDRLTQAQRRLDLVEKIEAAQETKLNYERERLKKGRSVTYQVIQFELDFAASQLARIKTVYEVLNILAQMKTFVVAESSKP